MFVSSQHLSDHLSRFHAVSTDQFSPIPQVDGPLSPSSLTSVQSMGASRELRPDNVRTANYSLDRNKQLSRLCKDTRIEDYDITVSPVAHNVTIKCSAGFYTKVVLTSFANMSLQYQNKVDDIIIKCTKVEGQVDETGASVTAKVVFDLSNEKGRDKSTIGTVTVHLHHTSRKVQLQGSALVYGKVRAPIWFVDKFLKRIFSHNARSKSLDITNFNNAVHDILANHLQKRNDQDRCKACSSPLTGRSVPEYCSFCRGTYHRSCYHDTKRHKCRKESLSQQRDPSLIANTQGARSLSHLAPRPPAIPDQTVIPPAEASLITGAVSTPLSGESVPVVSSPPTTPLSTSHMISQATNMPPMVVPAVSGPAVPAPATPGPSGSPQHTPDPLLVTIPATMNPHASDFVPTNTASNTNDHIFQPGGILPSTAQNRPKKPPKKGLPQQDLNLEYYKIELNTAQASIVVLESTISDLRFRNKLLDDRLKQLEDGKKKEIFDKYFPKSSDQHQGRQSCPQQTPSHCQYYHQITRCCHPPLPTGDDLQIFHIAIETIKADIAEIKAKLETHTDNAAAATETEPVNLQNQHDTPASSHSGSAPSAAALPPPQPTQPPVQLQNLDTSVTDLEEEMSDIELSNHLNCG